jgi:serine/threonine protein kinase
MSGATLVWLDALAGGLCTPDAFLTAMRDDFHRDPDESWEVLSLLDQYYRRGKIKPEIFHSVKSQLEGSALNVEKDPLEATPAPAPAAAPAPAPAPAFATATVTAPIRTPAAAAAYVRAPAAAYARGPAAAAAPKFADTAARDSRAPGREAAVGDTLRKRYRLRAVLGHGAMGTVFDAIDEYRLDMPRVGQRLALKVLHTAVSKRRELLSELQMEFQYLQSLAHPNIIRVHEFDRDGDIAFFTMEFLSGALLGRVLAARNAVALPRPDALAMIRDIGAALAHAHSRAVVHGNLNPQNIFITNDGELRVLEFGTSRTLIPTLWPADGELPQSAPAATRGYASCEVLEGQHADRRDDVFAFSCIAYELLSGQHPFPHRTAVEARGQRLRPSRPRGLTGQQWQVLREGMRWDREQRLADIQSWLQRFGAAGAAARLPPLPALVNIVAPPQNNLGRAVAAVIAIALLASAAYWATVNYDYLSSTVAAWLNQAKPTPAVPIVSEQTPATAATAPPAMTAPPAVTAPPATTPRPAATPPRAMNPSRAMTPAPSVTPPAAMKQSAPAAVTRAAPASRPGPAPLPMTTLSSQAPNTAQAKPPPTWTHVELAADTLDVQAGDPAAHVIVARRGSLHGDASFTWWTESGTAKPGVDFSAVTPREGHIAEGSGSVSLSIPISGAPRTQPKSFYVVIDRSESGATLGARTLTMVTLQPPG